MKPFDTQGLHSPLSVKLPEQLFPLKEETGSCSALAIFDQ